MVPQDKFMSTYKKIKKLINFDLNNFILIYLFFKNQYFGEKSTFNK